ncbi:hypothetical protein AVEN_124170-1 [Araneus ventricosus]|uniref:Uncharacterized protein n=1 Tax=Araneus ventricosus TaxID=182803 RepID=A0A4Y2PJ99_ARAVE|nr:hypothetical protein AVEN_124170-1 [Araneus ventricosus]
MRKPVPNFEQEWLKRVANNLVSRHKIRRIVKFISVQAPKEVKTLMQEFPNMLEAARQCRQAKTRQEKIPGMKRNHTASHPHQAEETLTMDGSLDSTFRSISYFKLGPSVIFHQARGLKPTEVKRLV